MVKLQAWLEENVRGVFWGSYRCEKWGKQRGVAARREPRHRLAPRRRRRRRPRAPRDELIDLLLAPDSAGNEQALARRMGVEELIWDCEYWAAGHDRASCPTAPATASAASRAST